MVFWLVGGTGKSATVPKDKTNALIFIFICLFVTPNLVA
jgi:hypothetical protein